MQPFLEIVLLVVGTVAGFIGSMTGLGGAVVIMPVLSLFLGVPVEYAVGASLVSTIATSSGSAAAYVRDKITNIRIGMSLEIATTMGAIVGALTTALIYAHGLSRLIFVLFGVVLLLSVFLVLKRRHRTATRREDWSTRFFQMRGSYYDDAKRRRIRYAGIRWVWGEAVMACAGFFSGLLGIGSGVLKVLGMDSAMHLPMKVSTATSDFMIGVTAVAGSGVYWALGYIKPPLVAPIIIGVAIGSYAGSRMMVWQRGRTIAMIFAVAMAAVAVEMILRGLGIA